MGSRVSPNLKCWQFRAPYCSPCDSWKTLCVVPSLLMRHATETSSVMPRGLVYRSTFSGSTNLRVLRGKRVHSSLFDNFYSEEMMNLVEDGGGDENGNIIGYENVWRMKPEVLEPSELGIHPEPPSWPERDENLRLFLKRKLNGLGIPLSIRMIRKKLKEGLKEAYELNNSSSVKRAFSSMLFIMHQLQNHALQTRESLCCEDLSSVMAKLQRDVDTSFVCLFKHVFWKTPNLMVDLMVLLANYSVFSMNNDNVKPLTPSVVTKPLPMTKNESKIQQHSQVDVPDVDQGEFVKELTEEEQMLWNCMLMEASTLQNELTSEDLDHETMNLFVAPVSVELEGDQYEEYVKTELYYKMHLLRSPQSSLLLSNYAQFLFLVAHDIDGAEEFYKRSVLVESPEAEAFSRYGDFLLKVRKDAWAAELRYLQALDADPGNTYYLAKYASLIWKTGGQDTSDSPMEELDNLQL